MASATAVEQRSVSEWESVLRDLEARRAAAHGHQAELRERKADISLQASLGDESARKELKEINKSLASMMGEADDYDSALTEANARLKQAQADAADKAERERMAAMSVIARKVLNHAAVFTGELRSAVESARAVKAATAEMIRLATPEERSGLDRILRPEPYMRCAEFAGLRDGILEFVMYPGPKAHIVALEEELSVYLSRWLKDGKE
jgi:hypothetical protein